MGRLMYVAENPNGEFLSLSEVPFKTLYIVTAALWSSLLMIWTWNWFRYRWFNVRLQKLISIVPTSKALISCTLLFYWREGSETGQFPVNWARANYVMSVVDLGCFFGSLLMVAKGWMITRGALHTFEVRRVSAMIFLLMVSKALYIWVNGFVLFFLVIMYVLMLRYIFSSIVENTTNLSNQIAILRTIPNFNISKTPVWTKQKMYKRFQVAMVVYISVDVIFHLWATIFLSATPWVEDAMEHFISALMVMCVGYTYAMRPFNPFFFRVVRDQSLATWNPIGETYETEVSQRSTQQNSIWSKRKSSLLISGPQSDANEEPQSSRPYMWRPGMPVPKMPSPSDPKSWFSWFLGLDTNDSGPGIIIENPADDSTENMSRRLFLAEPAVEGQFASTQFSQPSDMISSSQFTTSNEPYGIDIEMKTFHEISGR